MSDGHSLGLELLAILNADPKRLPGALQPWLCAGLRAHFDHGIPLETALGLSAPGKPTSATRLNRARRNVALREAAALVGTVPDLATAVSRFRSGKWRRWRDRTLPPEQASELDELLFEAFRCGSAINPEKPNPVPGSLKQLERILGQKQPGSFVHDHHGE